ncbi:MAG TPA: SMP-30/gluconolactonase/LRE family protein [Trebonia sp.]
MTATPSSSGGISDTQRTAESTPSFEVWSGGGYELAEGTRWLGDHLIFTDILAGVLLAAPAAGPGAARPLVSLDVPLGAVAPVAGQPGTWIAAAGTGIALIGPDGTLSWLDRPEDQSPVSMRMNDGCCDPGGRFWAGSMAYDAVEGAGSLYRADANGAVTRVLDGMTIVNGPAFTADGTRMYMADTFAGLIYVCDVDPRSGELSGHRVFAEVPSADGSPDGMTVDDAGRLWVALWDGSAVRCYRPDGTVEATVPVPAQRPTCVCLGGGALFVSTAGFEISDPAPGDGAILCARSDSAPAGSALAGASAAPAAAFRLSLPPRRRARPRRARSDPLRSVPGCARSNPPGSARPVHSAPPLRGHRPVRRRAASACTH